MPALSLHPFRRPRLRAVRATALSALILASLARAGPAAAQWALNGVKICGAKVCTGAATPITRVTAIQIPAARNIPRPREIQLIRL